jgi:penicillin amidase
MPGVWFEVHLSAPGIDVRGVALPFAPGVLLGHNDRMAWGCTNVGGDTMDLYLERLNPDGTAALYEGTWEPVTVHREEIRVRGRTEPEVVEVKETRHGPILDSYMVGVNPPQVVEGGIRETYALRWVGLDEAVEPSALFDLNTATTFEQFQAALSRWSCPGPNFVYADVDGNIGYQCTGWHPIRRSGDGTMPVPGWSSEYDWDGYVPFEEMPWAFNPEAGYLATANAKPYDDSYRWDLGKDFFPSYRARRITELLLATDRHDVDSFGRIHTDFVSLAARDLRPGLLAVQPATERQREALALLADWDGDLSPSSGPAAVYEVWSHHIALAVLRPKLGDELTEHYYGKRQWTNTFQCQVLPALLAYPTAEWFGADGAEARDAMLREALERALDELSAALGEDMASWAWGSLHRLRFVGQLGIIPDLTELFTGGECAWGGDEQTVNQGMFLPGESYDTLVIASWRQIIDLADLDRSVGTIPVGQSGNPASSHYADLFPLWSTGQYHPLPFTRPAVEAATDSVLDLTPE